MQRRKRFVDLDNEPIEHCFKLYPWEWLWHEEFGPHLAGDSRSVHRADLENAAQQQRAAADSVGAFPGAPEPAARL